MKVKHVINVYLVKKEIKPHLVKWCYPTHPISIHFCLVIWPSYYCCILWRGRFKKNLMIRTNHWLLHQINALYNSIVLLIQYSTDYGMQVPLCEYVIIVHCLFHGCHRSYSKKKSQAETVMSEGDTLCYSWFECIFE